MADKYINRIKNTLSYTMVIPRNQEVLEDMDAIAEKLEENCPKYNIEFIELGRNENLNCRMATIRYLGKEFKVNFFKEPFYKKNQEHLQIYHKMNYAELELLEKDKLEGITIAMDYYQSRFHPIVCFHVQLKMMCCLIENVGLCIDFNAERILSGVWCSLQAKTTTPPGLKYLYTIQCVGSDTDDNKVWIHTHGLNRCGFIEYEIMDSNVELCNDHAMILSNFCDWVISNPKPIEEGSPIVIGRDINGKNIVFTWINWITANQRYDKMLIGGANYRDVLHSQYIGTVYALKDENSTEPLPLSEFDVDNYRTSSIVLPEQENVRISTLAKERINFLRNWSALSSAKAKVKIALEIPEKLKTKAQSNFEHLWATLHKLDKANVYCEILDVPRYVSSVKQGDKIKISLDNLSDWYLEVDNMRITPDSVYQLVE
ncbi:MAG: DUF4026 domain-containing protein [Oscillospiraceae bacterium]